MTSPRRSPQSGGEALVDWLVRRGVTHVFQVPGESFLPILEALRTAPQITVVTNRHEASAGFAAEAFGKLTGRPAACVVTRGPGLANLSIAIQTAHYDATPLLAFVGLTPRSEEGSGAFQEIDVRSFSATAKRTLTVSSRDTLVATLEQAYIAATDGRPGPVVIGLPTDILSTPGHDHPTTHLAQRSDHFDAATILSLVQGASRPVIVAGTSAVRGPAAQRIARFAEASGLPVIGAWRAYSAFDNDHPQFLGSLGLGADPAVAAAVRSADCVVAFGFAFDQITARSAGFPRPDATVVQIAPEVDDTLVRHVHPSQVVQCAADPASAAEQLSALISGGGGWPRPLTTDTLAPSRASAGPLSADSVGVNVSVLMAALDHALEVDAIVSSDAGNFAQWLLRHVRFGADRAYIGPRNGAMGYGIPGAVGASFAYPDRPCWAVCGDGGGLMTVNDLAVAAESGRRLRFLVVDNHAYGTIRARQDAEYPGHLFGTSLTAVDFAGIGTSFGIATERIERNDQVDEALKTLSAADGPALLHVIVAERPLSADS